MMNITSSELLRRKAILDTLMKRPCSEAGGTTFSPACVVSVGEKRKRNDTGGDEPVQSVISESVGVKFKDFGKLREEVNVAVGQTWAVYDKVDGMPRLYAHIRKVSAPSFGLRVTYLEPDPEDEKEILWFEQDLPVTTGKFRLGKNQNTRDRCKFSHLMQCNKGIEADHFNVSPRKGETWAMFKNWDIKWSSEPDSHRKYEYQFVEVLSDYTDGAGVSVAYLHRAKGFASVFFRMGTGDADISQILPGSLYQFSHRIPSFKMTGVEGKGVPKDAYELDQAALPETIEEIIVPSHLLAEPMDSKPKPEALRFPRGGKVFQTGQIWSFSGDYDTLPRFYCRIQKITLIETFEQAPEFKLHVNRLKPVPFPRNVIQWKDKNMPVGCGNFFAMKGSMVFDPVHVIHQIMPQASMDGKEYTILPKIGEVWAIYRFWSPNIHFGDLEEIWEYDIVQVLDDALDFKVLQLEPALCFNEDDKKKETFKAAETRKSYGDAEDGSDVIFTILKSEMIRFSHQVRASRVTKEIDGEMKELFEVDPKTLPYH